MQVYAINNADITICEVIQDGKDLYCGFLGYDAVKSGKSVPAFLDEHIVSAFRAS
jgi:hypothetical protein